MKAPEISRDFVLLLEYLKRNRGFDFTGYKSASVMRRIVKRMESVDVQEFADYIDYLEVHPEEFPQLFNTILINVTGFFRDAANWDFVISEVLPRIVASKSASEPIRVWSAGCASGEEPYSAAMAFAEALGMEQFRERVKIYATDVDEEALNQARQAAYDAKEIQGVSQELVEKYFEQPSGRYIVHKDLRKSVIFGRHDLIQDAPISRVDLLICRNTLMYFNSETQARILSRFHFALRDGGYLFLGKAEMLYSGASTFRPVDLRRRVFTSIHKGSLREKLIVLAQSGSEDEAGQVLSQVKMRDAAFDESGVAQLVVDPGGILLMANDLSRRLFGVHSADIAAHDRDGARAVRTRRLAPLLAEEADRGRPICR